MRWCEARPSTRRRRRACWTGVACDWRKSPHSGSEGGACVEIATHPAANHVRDSKNPGGPSLTLAPAACAPFVSDLR
ncbi:DUF397 domain-containing protein [Streptomyces sp. Tu 2975]|uniref:DUF397 domain-containing protein n=1 Tax=Streptomyces sp. Tu 2975 TaxID=2676871 RepID=UPI0013579C0A|nr:DUF397 domain-containing protein [Streptomyces sp. Tu 2975]QIP85287.1 DUF397 domain-containing protein [Streptomyces sp. Tu 2975]